MTQTTGYQKLEGPQQLAETSVEMEGEDYVALSDAPPEYDVDFERTEVMDKGTRTTIMSHALTHDPALLIQYLQWQRQSAPDSFVRIVGTHKNSRFSTPVSDFDIKISLCDFLALQQGRFKMVPNSWKTYRGTRTKVDRLDSDTEACRPVVSLEEHCRDFLAYKRGPKQFAFSIKMGSLDHLIPVSAIKKAIAGVKYKGKICVEIKVPEEHTTVILSDHIMTRLERENWFGVFCILSQLWIVFLLLQLVLRKRWAILTIDWRAECKPRCPRKEDDEKEISRNGKVIASGNIGASTANMDANDWMNRWNIAIVRAAMNGQKGTIECSEKDELGDPLKPIRDLEEMREWGANE